MGRGPIYTKLERYWLCNFIRDNPHVGVSELAQMAHDYGILPDRTEAALVTQISNMRKEPAVDSTNATLKADNENLKRQNAELQQRLNMLEGSIIGGLHLREDKHGNKFVALTYGPVKKTAEEIWHTEYNEKISELYQEEGIDAYQLKLL